MSYIKKLAFLLSTEKKRKLYILIILMVFGIFFEMLGLASLLPILNFMMTKDIGASYPFLVPFLDFIGNPNQGTLVIIGMLLLVIIYCFKTLFLIYLTWYQSNFNSKFQAELSEKFFNGYVRMPYSFHLERNSSSLLTVIQNELGSLFSAIQSIIILITEMSLLLGILVILFFIEPVGALSVFFLLGISSALFNILTSKKLRNWGQKRVLYVSAINKHLMEGFAGVKELKLLGREDYFSQELAKNLNFSTDITIKQTTLQQVPRFYLELLGIIGLTALVISMVIQSRPMDQMVPVLGIFLASAFRMLPSLNRIMGSIQNIHYCKPSLNVLYREFKVIKEQVEPVIILCELDFQSDISIHNLFMKYPNTKTEALKDVSIKIKKGELIGLIGPSGSGKSTLVDIMLGLLTATRGDVTLDDKSVFKNLRQWQDMIGYVPQSIYLTDDSLKRNIAFGVSEENIDTDALNYSINCAQLEEFITSLPQGINTIVGERGVRLSGGQRQRIGIARALYNNPSIMFLDEATSALDNKTETEVMKSILSLKGNKTIIMVAHRLSTLVNCDRIYRLVDGEVVEMGAPEKILN